MSRDILLEIWRRACLIYHFELAVCKAVDEKRIVAPVYISLGQEFIPAAVSVLCSDWPLFAQHRCHGWYLAWGGDMELLIEELISGRCGSASIHIPGKMYGHDGLMGSQVPIATGYALATGKPVVCVIGDGAAEEDYALATYGWAATRKLPILFVVENNGLSILTEVDKRRSWSVSDAAAAMGCDADDVYDEPHQIIFRVRDFVETVRCGIPKPSFIQVNCCRHRWHCGSGVDGKPEWNRRALVAADIGNAGATIDAECRDIVEKAWVGRI